MTTDTSPTLKLQILVGLLVVACGVIVTLWILPVHPCC